MTTKVINIMQGRRGLACDISHHSEQVQGLCTDKPSADDALRLDSEYLTWGCHICEMTVSALMDVPKLSLRAPTRCPAEIAMARQVAMYLAHTMFGLLYKDVGIYFGRDRTTVTHACHLIEDKRDNEDFDALLAKMEGIVGAAKAGVSPVRRQSHPRVAVAM